MPRVEVYLSAEEKDGPVKLNWWEGPVVCKNLVHAGGELFNAALKLEKVPGACFVGRECPPSGVSRTQDASQMGKGKVGCLNTQEEMPKASLSPGGTPQAPDSVEN